jgi:hypothetical protein
MTKKATSIASRAARLEAYAWTCAADRNGWPAPDVAAWLRGQFGLGELSADETAYVESHRRHNYQKILDALEHELAASSTIMKTVRITQFCEKAIGAGWAKRRHVDPFYLGMLACAIHVLNEDIAAIEERSRKFQKAGTDAIRAKGKVKANAIKNSWLRYGNHPRRGRANLVAKEQGVTATHVRRVIAQKKNRSKK